MNVLLGYLKCSRVSDVVEEDLIFVILSKVFMGTKHTVEAFSEHKQVTFSARAENG